MPSRRQARRRWSAAFGADSARDYASTDFLADRGQSLGDDDHRPIVNLLVEQIEFADVIVLNKLDIAKPHEIEAARAIIRSLNAEAKIVETTEGRPAVARSARENGRRCPIPFPNGRAEKSNSDLGAVGHHGLLRAVSVEERPPELRASPRSMSLPGLSRRPRDGGNRIIARRPAAWPMFPAKPRAVAVLTRSNWPHCASAAGRSSDCDRRSRTAST